MIKSHQNILAIQLPSLHQVTLTVIYDVVSLTFSVQKL